MSRRLISLRLIESLPLISQKRQSMSTIATSIGLVLLTVSLLPAQLSAADIGSYESYTESVDKACYARE
jgi:hypothetical protein